MTELQKAIDNYIYAIKFRGPLAQSDAKASVLMEVSNIQTDPNDRKRLLALVENKLKEAFSE